MYFFAHDCTYPVCFQTKISLKYVDFPSIILRFKNQTACSKISKCSLTVSKAEWRSIKRSWSSWTCLSSKSVAENWVLSKKIEKIDSIIKWMKVKGQKIRQKFVKKFMTTLLPHLDNVVYERPLIVISTNLTALKNLEIGKQRKIRS